MAGLIVIQIVPEAPVDPMTFQGYLAGLQIQAFDLSFATVDENPPGQSVGTALYIPATGWVPPLLGNPDQSTMAPTYPAGITSGIIQQVDYVTSSGYYQYESVAIAIISVTSAGTSGNFRVEISRGAQKLSAIPYQYERALDQTGTPDPATWPTLNADNNWVSSWAAQPVDFYVSLPATTTTALLQLPDDGTPPPYGTLLAAVQQALSTDPGAVPPIPTAGGGALAGDQSLTLTTVTGIAVGMLATGGTIPPGTTVVSVGPGNTVGLSQELTGAMAAGTNVTFAANLATLSLAQCKNIAYEIIWGQQSPLPTPPDPIEDLYTDPPNNGELISGTTPNPDESDRQQFEGKLKSYYAVADTTADRLTNFVYALSAAAACEQQSLAATQVMLQFPAYATLPGGGSSSQGTVILTGVFSAGVAGNFGVPAAHFYALAATMPAQITAVQRFQRATGDQLSRLTDLTTAINAGTISDSESCYALPAVTVNAAQAARRLAALGVPAGSATPLAPLGSVALPTTADAPSGTGLTFAATTGVANNMLVSGPGIAPGATVQAFTPTTITLSAPLLDDVPAGSMITVTPAYPADLQQLVASWLAYPATAPSGAPSSETYQPADDAANFWPGAAAAHPAGFLNLILAYLTQGYVIPAPFDVALGTQIIVFLAALPGTPAVPTVATLASVTAEQWQEFFQQNPTWLPPSTQPGNTTARIAAFIGAVQNLFAVGTSGPSSAIILATSAQTTAGTATANVLTFASTNGVVQGMTVTGPGTDIGPGVTVQAVTPTSVTLSQAVAATVPSQATITFTPGFLGAVTLVTNALTPGLNDTLHFAATTGVVADMTVTGPTAIAAGTTVTNALAASVKLSQQVTAAGVAAGIPVTFTPAAAAPGQPLLQAPTPDLLGKCLAAYGAYTLGHGFDPAQLATAAATVVPDDLAAQAWLVDALVTIDALYQVMIPVALATPALTFSVVEALYARGFRAAADMTDLDPAHFQEALTGTVAYDSAPAIYASAKALAPPQAQPTPPGGFKPVNPGTLTDCIPAPCASPLGPIAYLHELLTISELSTCDAVVAGPVSRPTAAAAAAGANTLPFVSAAGIFPGMSASAAGIPDGTTVTGTTTTSVMLSASLTAAVAAGTIVTFTAPTLGAVLNQRRGPVGDLTASCANLETQLPLIDIVNECLEYLGAAVAPASGTIYDTASDTLAGLELCTDEPCPDHHQAARCHDPGRLFASLPQYSTPATPVPADAAVEPTAFNKLKADFSACLLPYSQAIDVSRTYLRHLGSCRFEEMRTFRKCITEFVLDPAHEPAGFWSWLWRYPVRIDIAIEYLGITPEEYTVIFHGAAAPPCAGRRQDDAVGADFEAGLPALEGTIGLPAFLAETCLSYCEFYELWTSGFVKFRNGADERDGTFPQCEPCCLDDLWLSFGEEQQEQGLTQLLVFVRLWRKLRESCCFCYSFAQLRDICEVLGLYHGGALNPDFVRQLAAFQMLRDHFGMDLSDPDEKIPPTATGAARTQLLALWAEPAAAHRPWAVRQLITRVEQQAQRRHDAQRRPPDFVKILADNLDPLSRLAGFDPASATDSWHAQPTNTLRYAEVLAKIYASPFIVGELIFLFTAGPHLDGEDPFPLQAENDALDLPLGLPDEEDEHALWRLRRELLAVRVAEDEAEEWPWRRIEAALHTEFGFAASDIQALGQHFFPGILARSGYQVNPAATRFVTSFPVASPSGPAWNTPPDGPWHYDPAGELSVRLPLTDRALITKLTEVPGLNSPAERDAVQDLFFQPRAMLARFALLFADFATAQRWLIEEADETERFGYFRYHFLLCCQRRHVIARHLSRHVAAATGQRASEDDPAAELILRTLNADENKAGVNWENDLGTAPGLTWAPSSGSALAALLGLTGTGLIAEYRPAGNGVAWRDGTGPLSGFGAERDRENCPVPTVLPSLAAQLTPEQLQFASVHNGLLMKDATGEWDGGAQGFTVTWSGALLVDREGTYEFWAGAPAPDEERPDFEAAEHRRWRVELRRGQRSWVILSHHWAGEEERRFAALPLRRGAYELTAELIQPAPEFSDDEQVRPQHTGFQVKYSGPDSDDRRTEIPHNRLFVVKKDSTLGDGIPGLSPGAAAYLGGIYLSSLRDIRRTYQRAFKALLFTHRFELSAQHQPPGTAELGYLLAQPTLFPGAGYYRTGAGFTRHLADFDFDFLPLRDNYYPPAGDARTGPKPQRIQAMFDWWERMFDYTAARAEVHRRCGRQLWHLFEEAQQKQPAHPGFLLRHMGADARHWHLDLRYFQGQNVPVYDVTSTDLEDDRWVLRAWHADRWLRDMECCFTAKDIAAARPDLWASDDPSTALPGETETGNANLTAFVREGCLDNGEPRRYDDLRRLNDGLGERGRNALVAYLCHMNRVALPWRAGHFVTTARDLSDLLLLDVEAGLREKASRIDEAITAAQSFVRRARLNLEPDWTITPAFARLWDREFATFHVWQACRRRRLYQENWVEWDALDRAREVEGFRFLQDRLRDGQLTVAAPGGLDWWPDQRPPGHDSLELLQRAEASGLRQLAAPREGLSLLGTPERAARPSWLAPLQASGAAGGAGAAAGPDGADLPYWLQAAIRLGTRFWRIAAAGVPPAGNGWPRTGTGDPGTA